MTAGPPPPWRLKRVHCGFGADGDNTPYAAIELMDRRGEGRRGACEGANVVDALAGAMAHVLDVKVAVEEFELATSWIAPSPKALARIALRSGGIRYSGSNLGTDFVTVSALAILDALNALEEARSAGESHGGEPRR